MMAGPSSCSLPRTSPWEINPVSNSMACTYGGIPLSIPTPEVIAWVEKYVSPEELLIFDPPASGGPAAWARTQPLPLPPVQLGKFFYPMNGAANFAVGYFLATDNQLQQIRPLAAQTYTNSTSHGL